jgi:hypothetical protein
MDETDLQANFITYPGGTGEPVKGWKLALSAHAKKYFCQDQERESKKRLSHCWRNWNPLVMLV